MKTTINILLISLLILSGCSSVFYHPTSYLYSDPRVDGYDVEVLNLLAHDMINLTAWHIRDKKSTAQKALIVQFHGNAENMSSHYRILSWLLNYGHELLVFDYRGYGPSQGKPSQTAISQDMKLMLDTVERIQREGHYNKLILIGQSLGGAILLDGLANKLKDPFNTLHADLMIIDSSFLSYQDVAASKVQLSWITWWLTPLAYVLISDSNAPANIIDSTTFPPTLVIHGTNDIVIPQKFGKQLFAKLKTPFKTLWDIEGGNHIDCFSRDNYRTKLLHYLETNDLQSLNSNH